MTWCLGFVAVARNFETQTIVIYLRLDAYKERFYVKFSSGKLLAFSGYIVEITYRHLFNFFLNLLVCG